MKPQDEKQAKEFDKWGKTPPVHSDQGEDSWEHPLSAKLTQAKCSNWTLEGNQLKCDTDFGPFSQTISSDYILVGEENGLPILKKVVL